MHKSSHKKLLNDVAIFLAITAPADDVRAYRQYNAPSSTMNNSALEVCASFASKVFGAPH